MLTGIDKKKVLEDKEKYKHEKMEYLHKMEKEAISFQRKHSEELKKQQEEQNFMKMTPQEKEKHKKLKEAELLKHNGNEEQKKQNYDGAIKFFEDALKIAPEDISINLNLASAYLEKKDYENCIKECEKVLKNCSHDDKSKKSRAYGKIGIANLEMKNNDKAIEYLKLSMNEHRDDRIEELLADAEDYKKKNDCEKYIDAEKAEQHNKQAYDLYKLGKIEEALKEYSVAIKRNPMNSRYYCNRAEAFIKVLDLNDAIRDCEKAIELDNKFLRAYLRKATAHMMLKQYPMALETYEMGLEIEKDHEELLEGKKKCFEMMSDEMKDMESWQKSAPKEIKTLLLDEKVQKLLDDFKHNPLIAHQALKQDKYLKQSFHKLVEYGMMSSTK